MILERLSGWSINIIIGCDTHLRCSRHGKFMASELAVIGPTPPVLVPLHGVLLVTLLR